MKLTFLDTGVLITAARGNTEQSARALETLDDPEREFAPSHPASRAGAGAVHNKRETDVASAIAAACKALLLFAALQGSESGGRRSN